MKGIILLADYFEDVEALITIDMLRRAHINIDLISMNDTLEVITQSNVKIIADKLVKQINCLDYDFLVIPGGKATFLTHQKSEITKSIVKSFMDRNKLVASICAAPSILGLMGYLDNIPFTCFAGCEKYMPKGIYQPNKNVVIYNNIITSKAAGTTFDFSKAIIAYLTNSQLSENVIKSVYYE